MSEKKRRCFVIGPIGKEGSLERKHADMLLNNVIREALKDCDPPYEVVRSDEIPDPGMITDLMIYEIMNAELVIADLTYLNANAFYEIGIRHAALKPAIHFAQSGTELPFDAMAHRAVIEDITSWEGTQRARRKIRELVRATEAADYRVSNPITQANASFRMRQSADPTEQVVAALEIRVEQLEAHIRRRSEETSGRLGSLLLGPDAAALGDYETFLTEHEYARVGKVPQESEKFLVDLPTDVDRVLFAGYIVERRSIDAGFTPGEANAVLSKYGVKIGNAIQCLKQNLLAKRVFKHEGRYRVSQIGLDHLRHLVGSRSA
jgi:hypothetical protein